MTGLPRYAVAVIETLRNTETISSQGAISPYPTLHSMPTTVTDTRNAHSLERDPYNITSDNKSGHAYKPALKGMRPAPTYHIVFVKNPNRSRKDGCRLFLFSGENGPVRIFED